MEAGSERSQVDLESLVASAASGERADMDRLVQRLRPFLRAAVRRALRPPLSLHDEADLCQEVELHLLARLRRVDFRGDGPFHRWLLTVATNRVRREAESRQARKRRPEAQTSIDASNEPWTDALRTAPETSFQRAVRTERATQVQQAIQRLRTDARYAIQRIQFEGASTHDVARELSISERHVRRLQARALTQLAEQLRDSSASEDHD